jgi:hypothetical protein
MVGIEGGFNAHYAEHKGTALVRSMKQKEGNTTQFIWNAEQNEAFVHNREPAGIVGKGVSIESLTRNLTERKCGLWTTRHSPLPDTEGMLTPTDISKRMRSSRKLLTQLFTCAQQGDLHRPMRANHP